MTRLPYKLILVLVLWPALALPPVLSAGVDNRRITENDLFRFTWAADPQMAPDGSRVAFVQVTANQEKDAYETSLWLVSTKEGKPQRLTNGPHDSGPCWSPDGNWLLFLRALEKDGKPQPPQLY